jgi:hypothetical protein
MTTKRENYFNQLMLYLSAGCVLVNGEGDHKVQGQILETQGYPVVYIYPSVALKELQDKDE